MHVLSGRSTAEQQKYLNVNYWFLRTMLMPVLHIQKRATIAQSQPVLDTTT